MTADIRAPDLDTALKLVDEPTRILVLGAVGEAMTPLYERIQELEAELGVVEADRDEWEQCAEVEADLRREFLAHANAAEVRVRDLRVRELEEGLKDLLDWRDWSLRGVHSIEELQVVRRARALLDKPSKATPSESEHG